MKEATLYQEANTAYIRVTLLSAIPLALFYVVLLMTMARVIHLDISAVASVVAALTAFEAYILARLGLKFMTIQIRQADEAKRDSLLLLLAIETLTKELQRRPEPAPPSVINFAVFGRM
jgi:hypothetical protein